MALVKFDKSVKYNGIRYVAHQEFEVKDKDVAELKRAGAIVVSAPPKSDEQEPVIHNDENVFTLQEKLLGYTVSELMQFAEERGIDLQGKTRKADIYNIIVASLK